LSTPSYTTIGDLVNASSWDFSGNAVRHAITGTTTANNTKTVTGTGTNFTADLVVGDFISLSPAPTTYGKVTAISSATSLTTDTTPANARTQTISPKSPETGETPTTTPPAETCNWNQCGYRGGGGDALERSEKNVDLPSGLDKTNDVARRDNRVSDVTIWL